MPTAALIHTVACTTAKVADITMMEACLHGEETLALGDRGYHKTNRTIEHFKKEGDLSVPDTDQEAGRRHADRRIESVQPDAIGGAGHC